VTSVAAKPDAKPRARNAVAARAGPSGLLALARPRSSASTLPVTDTESTPDPSGRAYWIAAPFSGELRAEALRPEGPLEGMLRVKAVVSAVSRGTEGLVHAGRIPPGERSRMRAPCQNGDFPFPVKYGYMAVGEVVGGPMGALGSTVFALHPHQDLFDVPERFAVRVPEGVPPRRAALAANMETAVNVTWDARVSVGDRVAVVGGGVVGLLVASLCARVPGADVRLVDVDPAREAVSAALGVPFALAGSAALDGLDADVVVHASGTEAGLRACLDLAGQDGRVVEASWHGDADVALPLGGPFHARRLTIASSQVGSIPPERAPRWGHGRRLALALELLRDPAYDALLTHEAPFEDAPRAVPAWLRDPSVLAATLTYS